MSNLQNSSDLIKNNVEKLQELKINNEIYLENIKKIKYEKLENDANTQKQNTKIINELGSCLVKVFFSKFTFPLWLVAYVFVFIFFRKYIELINNIGLFLIVFILGKFLKDQIGIITNNFFKPR